MSKRRLYPQLFEVIVRGEALGTYETEKCAFMHGAMAVLDQAPKGMKAELNRLVSVVAALPGTDFNDTAARKGWVEAFEAVCHGEWYPIEMTVQECHVFSEDVVQSALEALCRRM